MLQFRDHLKAFLREKRGEIFAKPEEEEEEESEDGSFSEEMAGIPDKQVDFFGQQMEELSKNPIVSANLKDTMEFYEILKELQ